MSTFKPKAFTEANFRKFAESRSETVEESYCTPRENAEALLQEFVDWLNEPPPVKMHYPLRVEGLCIRDAKGKLVCEAKNAQMARKIKACLEAEAPLEEE